VLESRAFMLRPEPAPAPVAFTGTYREAGWRRCGAMSREDGITFQPWPHAALPNWSLPALEAAKCAAKQGGAQFERVHLRLFRAYFTESRNIADREEVARIVAEAGLDMGRFSADYAAGIGREAVIADHTTAVAELGVQAIPAVIVAATGRRLVGLADPASYRAAIEDARAR
jgi:predicted DsbA family dithiol-disulfide isomerase